MRACLKLPQGLYYMSADSKGSRETAFIRRLTGAFAGHICDKYPFVVCWFIRCLENEKTLRCMCV